MDGDFCLNRGQVESMVSKAYNESFTVKTLVQAMEKAGCKIERSYFSVVSCGAQVNGGFSLEHGILLCHNRLQTYRDVEHALAHELVHAYDHCRVADLDWSNCKHHACTEVRAANLSGDCALMQELMRGNVTASPASWAAAQRRCVARRAALSVAMNPCCGGAVGARQHVEGVMEACMKDTAPFPNGPPHTLS